MSFSENQEYEFSHDDESKITQMQITIKIIILITATIIIFQKKIEHYNFTNIYFIV
jgi:hypothetical protein